MGLSFQSIRAKDVKSKLKECHHVWMGVAENHTLDSLRESATALA
jgi:hypothetical protein